MRLVKSASLFAAALMLLGTTPAFAQGFAATVIPDVIGATIGNMAAAQHEANCRAGFVSYSPERMARVRTGAQQAMLSYMGLAGAGPTDVRDAYFRGGNSQEWSLDGVKAETTSIDDPVARAFAAQPGAALAQPETFFLAGDGMSAAGSWVVRASDETDIGYYHAVVRSGGRGWKLTNLAVFTSAPATTLSQYCHVLGDVKPAAPASPEQLAASVIGPPPEGRGQVVFFRPSALPGSLVTYRVLEGETELGRLQDSRYFVHVAEPGAHDYGATRNETVHLDVEAGSTYYVLGTFVSGFWAGRLQLVASSEAAFDASAPNLQLALEAEH